MSGEPRTARRRFVDSVTPMARPEVPGSVENIASWRRDAERRLDEFLAIEVDARSLSAEGLREAVAEAIYDAMRENDPEGQTRPWIAGGNSRKQDEARRRARAALSREEATSE